MAEFEYFGTWADSWAMLTDIMKLDDYELLVDDFYEVPNAALYGLADAALETSVKLVPKVLLFGPFSKCGPVFIKQTAGEKAGQYYAAYNKGGPFLDLSLARETDSGLVGIGSLSYGTEFLDPGTGAWLKPAPEVRHAFNGIKSAMRRRLTKMTLRRPFWIAQDALLRLERGELRIGAAGVV